MRQRVCILLSNCIELPVALLAVQRLGAVCVPLNPAATRCTLLHLSGLCLGFSHAYFSTQSTQVAGMCTRPAKPKPRRDPRPMFPRPRQDRDVQNFVRDETEKRRCSFRDTGRDLEAPETLESLGSFKERLAETFSVTYLETH